MKRCKIMTLLLLFLFVIASVGSAEEPTSVYDEIENSKGKGTEQPQQQDQFVEKVPSVSIFPFLIKLVVSLTFIILLIYLVLKLWAQKTRGMQVRGPFLVLGGCPLGTNRSIQAVMIGKTIYILGVGENVHLIREVSQGEEYEHILNSFEEHAAPNALFGSGGWFKKKAKVSENSWEDQFQATLEEMENGKGVNDSEWLSQGKKGESWKL